MTFKYLLAASAAALLATTASAAVTQYTSLASFTAAGTITQSFDFDSFPSGFSTPGDPYTVGDVTFQSMDNLIVGTGEYGNPRNTIAYNFWTPLPGVIAGTHDLFGFNLTFSGSGQVDITLGTNLGSYTFTNLTAPYEAFAFQGFKAGAGEYFQSFSINALNGSGNLVMTTDYKLGTAGGVPEPASWVMMIGGFGMAGFVARRRRTALAV
jgi:hypothetical protein